MHGFSSSVKTAVLDRPRRTTTLSDLIGSMVGEAKHFLDEIKENCQCPMALSDTALAYAKLHGILEAVYSLHKQVEDDIHEWPKGEV